MKGSPNRAAASLTSTAMDLARFLIMLNQNGEYAGRRVLRSETVDRLLKRDGGPGAPLAEQQCSDLGTMGLGMRVRNVGAPEERYWHRGTHNGFRSFIWGFPPRQSGLVLMMSADPDDASGFVTEITSRFSNVYD